jgi:hypothetical protein
MRAVAREKSYLLLILISTRRTSAVHTQSSQNRYPVAGTGSRMTLSGSNLQSFKRNSQTNSLLVFRLYFQMRCILKCSRHEQIPGKDQSLTEMDEIYGDSYEECADSIS